MRILWLSHSPSALTGYGAPTALWLPELRAMGHDVTAAAFKGEPGDYRGVPVLDARDGRFGMTAVAEMARSLDADVIVTLMDAWVLDPGAVRGWGRPAVHWFPVDTTPLGEPDRAYFSRSPGFPVAMSVHGERMLAAAGLEGAAIPYAVDPAVFRPGEGSRADGRALMGAGDRFTVGIKASDTERKAWPEQLEAYARLWQSHPGEVLLSASVSAEGPVPVRDIAASLGLPPEAIAWQGPLDEPGLARWYRALDVLCACSLAEGFCLPVLEAEACGTPVITTDAPPVSTEAGLPGRHVAGEPYWSPLHRAWWTRPAVAGIAAALEDAFAAGRHGPDMAAVAHARMYSPAAIAPLWGPVLERAAARRPELTWK